MVLSSNYLGLVGALESSFLLIASSVLRAVRMHDTLTNESLSWSAIHSVKGRRLELKTECSSLALASMGALLYFFCAFWKAYLY